MAVTLAQSALLSMNALRRGVVETFIETSPVLDRLPLENIEGNAFAYNEEASLPGMAFRTVGDVYTESTGTVVQRTETLAILGGDADVDRFIVQTRGNLNDQRAVATKMKVKSGSIKFSDTVFNGDVSVDTKSFDGLKKRLTGGQVISMGTNGGPVVGNGGTDTQAFFDALDGLIAAVPGLVAGNGAIYCNGGILAKIRGAGRRIGGTATVREDLTSKRVLTWQGIPILDPGNTQAGGLILPQTEVQGTSTDASSVYAVKWAESEGENGVLGLTNGGVMVDDLGFLQASPVYRTRVEFYCGMASMGRAAARLTGVRNL